VDVDILLLRLHALEKELGELKEESCKRVTVEKAEEVAEVGRALRA
jgi:hypothetical protein